MIDERNLFEGRITEDERCKLLTALDILISEKQDALQRCDKIRSSLNKLNECYESFKKEGEERDEIEKLILKLNVIFKETQSPVEEKENIQIRLQKNDLYKKYKEELYEFVIPDRETMVKLGRPRHKAIYFSWFGPELFCLLLGPPGFNCWFSSAPVFQWCCSTPHGSPGVGRNTFLSSPHLCFIIVVICDLFVSRDDPLMS